MQLNANELRKGTLVTHQGRTCTVIYWNILRNDRRTFVQMKLKDLLTGRISEHKEHGDTKFEVLDSETIELEHSYRDGNDEVFYTPAGEEWRCPASACEDALRWKVGSYKGLLVDGKLATISLPQSVVVTVHETAPVIKGVSSGMKDAVLENGIQVKVGMLVQIGDRVRVDPETLEYKERVT
jgi:elongation factor P